MGNPAVDLTGRKRGEGKTRLRGQKAEGGKSLSTTTRDLPQSEREGGNLIRGPGKGSSVQFDFQVLGCFGGKNYLSFHSQDER